MMTQADVLSQNEEYGYDQGGSTTKNIISSFTSHATNNAAAAASTDLSSEQATASVNFERPSNLEFSDLNALSYLNEQSPIKPSKYLATDSAINTSVGLRNIIIFGMLFSGIVTIALIIQIMLGTTQVPYRIGIVTAEKTCSEIGSDMVRLGGKSFDAFIASSLCLGVVNPFSAGLGAGGFLLVRDHKHDRNWAINCWFKSSEGLELTDYSSNPINGIKSIAVPGEFKCLESAYKYARFYWKTLAAPAIKLAREGFKVSKSLAMHLKEIEDEIKNNDIMKEIYIVNGSLATENTIVKNLRLANALEALAYNEKSFYDGEIADRLSNEVNNQIKKFDLSNYDAVTVDTLSSYNYNDFALLTTNFPSNGPIIKFILDLVKSASLKASDFQTSEFYSRLLEATKLGYFMSSYVADPQYDPKLKDLYNQKLTLAKDYFNSQFVTDGTKNKPFFPFNLNETLAEEYNLKDDLHVNFVSVNDHNDIMISYVGTLGSAWGSKVISREGFFLNNGLSLFTYGQNSIKAGNTIDTNKQPRALITPIITYNKKNPCISRFSIA